MIKKYRKKPVVIEAVQWDSTNALELHDWMGESAKIDLFKNEIIIHTLEGDMTASKGDYIIKGVDGEFYPCKPDIFEKTYEEVFEPKPIKINKELLENIPEVDGFPELSDEDKQWDKEHNFKTFTDDAINITTDVIGVTVDKPNHLGIRYKAELDIKTGDIKITAIDKRDLLNPEKRPQLEKMFGKKYLDILIDKCKAEEE